MRRSIISTLVTAALLAISFFAQPTPAPIAGLIARVAARVGPRAAQAIRRQVRDEGQDIAEDAANELLAEIAPDDPGEGIGFGSGQITNGDGQSFDADAPFGCINGDLPAEDCEEFVVDKRKKKMKRSVGNPRYELVDVSDEMFWNSCAGQTATHGRPDMEWADDSSTCVMYNVQPACMVEVAWWNQLPEIAELEDVYGYFTEVDATTLRWENVPAEEEAMLRALANVLDNEGDRVPPGDGGQGASKPPPNKGHHADKGHGKNGQDHGKGEHGQDGGRGWEHGKGHHAGSEQHEKDSSLLGGYHHREHWSG